MGFGVRLIDEGGAGLTVVETLRLLVDFLGWMAVERPALGPRRRRP